MFLGADRQPEIQQAFEDWLNEEQVVEKEVDTALVNNLVSSIVGSHQLPKQSEEEDFRFVQNVKYSIAEEDEEENINRQDIASLAGTGKLI